MGASAASKLITVMKTIDVAKSFSPKPYGRHRQDGDFSAEVFREDILLPLLKANERVLVDLSGSNYFGSSFLEEVFGGLVRVNHFSVEDVLKKVEVRHELLPSMEEEVVDYIKRAGS